MSKEVVKQTLNSSRLYGQLVTPFFRRSIANLINFYSLYMNFRVRTWKDWEISENLCVFVRTNLFISLKSERARTHFFTMSVILPGGSQSKLNYDHVTDASVSIIIYNNNMMKSVRLHAFHSNLQFWYMISIINPRHLCGKP